MALFQHYNMLLRERVVTSRALQLATSFARDQAALHHMWTRAASAGRFVCSVDPAFPYLGGEVAST